MVAAAFATGAWAEPKSGDVFKEYIWKPSGNEYQIIAGRGNIKPSDPAYKNLKFKTPSFDLTGVTKVEVRAEIWSGHINTDIRQIRLNDNPYVTLQDNPIPNDFAKLPKGGIGKYMAFLYSTTEVPLSHFKPGINDFNLECEGGDWEAFDVWGIVFRFYYDPAAKPHPTGAITGPTPGALGESVEFKVTASSPNGAIKRVDYIGNYEDFNYTRDGIHQNWQYRTYHGVFKDHVGTATAAPFAVNWNTTWIPDQKLPMKFLARITDVTDITYITPVVEGFTLSRTDKSVKLYKAFDIPQEYIALVTRPRENKVQEIKEDLGKATAAKFHIVTYNGFAATAFGFNNKKVVTNVGSGAFVYSSDEVNVPLNVLQPGVNTAYVTTEQCATCHGVDVTWPGIELKVQYTGLPVSIGARPKSGLRGFGPVTVEGESYQANGTRIEPLRIFGPVTRKLFSPR